MLLMMKHAALVSCMGLVTLSVAVADQWDKRTVVDVKETIRVPNATLQPGQYVLKLVDSFSDRHIVRIFNGDESQVITTFLAIPNYRLKPTGNTVFMFWETPVGEPRAVRAWFYPGDNFGQEFAYTRPASTAIAGYANKPVLTLEEPQGPDLSRAEVQRENEQGRETSLWEAEAPAVSEASPEPQAAASEPAAKPAPALPRTASPIPEILLAGLASLAMSGLLWQFSRSTS